MKPPIYLGEFEYAVLLAILHLDQEAYAVPVRELIEERTGRPVAPGALYTALDRLEAKGCLRSRMGEPPRNAAARPAATSPSRRRVEGHQGDARALASMARGLETILEQS